MIRRPPKSTPLYSSAASEVYKRQALSSFVGLREIPQQHGLTVGELARLFNGEFLAEPADLEVVQMRGYQARFFENGWNLPWVLPSPNIPTQETAWVYP